jgi:hypothetical protein
MFITLSLPLFNNEVRLSQQIFSFSLHF